MVRNKILSNRRWMGVVAIVVTSIPIAVVVAPNQSRWIAAEGLDAIYTAFDDPSAVPHGPVPAPGLTAGQLQSQLLSTDSRRTWSVIQDKSKALSASRFAHEDPSDPIVEDFRERTKDLVTEPVDLLEVSNRVRALTAHKPETETNDVREILNHARNGGGVICHHFARVFGSVLSARGYTTRIVSLSSTGGFFDHAMCEVYDPSRAKWIVIDVDFCLAYQRDGKLLSALEVQDAWKKVRKTIGIGPNLDGRSRPLSVERIGELTGVEMVCFGDIEEELRTVRLEISPTGMNLELFEYFFLSLRDDYITGDYPIGHPLRVRQLGFKADEISDELCSTCPEAIYASADEVYSPVGASEIAAVAVTPQLSVELEFGTRTPNFLLFEYSIDSSPWSGTANSRLSWQLHGGAENQIRVRSVNTAGLRGAVTSLQIHSHRSGS